MSWDRLAELLPEEALEDALKGLGPNEITGPGGLLTQLAGRVIEIASDAELTEHLGHPPGGRPEGSISVCTRRSVSGATVLAATAACPSARYHCARGRPCSPR
jgi:hypothetical protein